MNEETKKAIDDSIEHWKRMIAWAKKQDKKELPCKCVMEMETGENWLGNYCSLCNLFHFNFDCKGCPILKVDHLCGTEEKSSWMKVHNSKTWGKWVKNAKKFLKILEGLREPEEEKRLMTEEECLRFCEKNPQIRVRMQGRCSTEWHDPDEFEFYFPIHQYRWCYPGEEDKPMKFEVPASIKKERKLMTRDQVLGFISNTPGVLVAVDDDNYQCSHYWSYEGDSVDVANYTFIRVDKKGNRLTEPSKFYADLLED